MPVDIDELAKAAKAATPGPWCSDDYVVRPGDSPGQWHVYEAGEDDGPLLSTMMANEADARYVAEADPATILALIARLRDAEAANERLRELLRECVEKSDRVLSWANLPCPDFVQRCAAAIAPPQEPTDAH